MSKYHLVLCALMVPVGGCSASGGTSLAGGNESADASIGNWGGAGGSNAGTPTLNFGSSGGSQGSGGAASLPPEQEQNLDFLAPRAGARYVYVANPSRNTVTVIDSTTLAISELTPGDSPTYVATVPGQDIALVINAGSHTLRVVRGTVPNDSPLPIVAKANTISISPDGLHAVIWFDPSQLGVGGSQTTSTATTGSTQEVSVIALASGADQVISMSVGYNPSAVVFSNDSAAAFVVTDDGISELRFAAITAPAIAPFTAIGSATTALLATDAGTSLPSAPDTLTDGVDAGVDGEPSPTDGGLSPVDVGVTASDVELAPDLGSGSSDAHNAQDQAADSSPANTPMVGGKPVDVSVTADGAYAIARVDGSAELLLVNLKTHTVTSMMLSSPVTDLDLLPSGTQAFAVLRDESTLVRVDIPNGFATGATPTTWQFDGVTIGSVTISQGGKYALLYTTAVPSMSLVILDFASDVYRTVDLHKAIRAIAIAPDQNTALVVHTAPSSTGSGGTTGHGSSAADHSYGYTVVRLGDGFTKLQETPAAPNPFAITPNSTYAFVLLRDDSASIRIAERISLTSFLADDFPLGSPPNSIAALSEATHKVFVGQVYPEGRISFIDWVSGSVESVTGFALNGRIQQ